MCLLKSQAFGREELGQTLPRRVFSLPCSLLTALRSRLAFPLQRLQSPLQPLVLLLVAAVGAELRLFPSPATALGTARPGTGLGALARRAELSLQITGASVGTEGERTPVSIQFCISVGRKSDGKVIWYRACRCEPGRAR